MAVGMAYKRYQREKHIKRKEHILKKYREDNMPSEFDTEDLWATANLGWPLYREFGSSSPYWYVKARGMLSKGKIHCSCGMCSSKTRNKNYRRRRVHGNYEPNINYKASDQRKIDAMNYQLEEWEKENKGLD